MFKNIAIAIVAATALLGLGAGTAAAAGTDHSVTPEWCTKYRSCNLH